MMTTRSFPKNGAGLLKRLCRAAGKLLLVMFDIYALTLIVYLLLRLIVNESQMTVLRFANNLMPAIILPSVALLLILLLARRWRHAALFIPPAAAVLMLYGGQFLPVSASSHENPLRMMTFNILGPMSDTDAVEAIIRNSGADLIALQEVNQSTALRFENTLADIYPYQAAFTDGETIRGVGLYSRFPISNARYIPGALGHMRAEISYALGDVEESWVVYSVHPPPPGMLGMNTTGRSSEIAMLLEQVAQETLPVILMGDFNMNDQSDDWQRVARHFADSFREAGQGFGPTWPDYTGIRSFLPGLVPLIRIDYIWHSPAFEAVNAWSVPEGGGSDHHPVMAELIYSG